MIWSTVEMEQGKRLSYSQIRLYSECGKKYDYYYNHKIREKVKSGALFFGTAIDKSVEAVLQDPKVNEKEIFDKHWSNQEINGKMVYLPESTAVVYASSDMDWDLLTEEDTRFLRAKLSELAPELGDSAKTAYEECAKAKKQRAFKAFKESHNKFFNLCNWLSLRRKAYLMLDAHRKQILPKITKIISTQSKVTLTNGEGDSLVGYADLVAHWDGEDEPTIFDYKTSSMEYDEDSVITSAQLTIYAHSLNIRKAGYIVFRKGILKNKVKICSKCGLNGSGSRAKTCTNEDTGKRCGAAWNETIKPEVDIQIIRDTIPERTEEIVIQNVDETNRAIKAGIYTRNFNSCHSSFGPCPYLSLCWKDKMSEELEKV